MADQPRCSCEERPNLWWEAETFPDGSPFTGQGWRRGQIDLEDLTGTYCPGCGDKMLPGGQVEPRAEADRALKAMQWVEEEKASLCYFVPPLSPRNERWQVETTWTSTELSHEDSLLDVIESAMAREASTDE